MFLVKFRPALAARVLAATCFAAAALSPSIASAHTDTDVVAVPAGEEATVTFRPQHGCAGSPTIAVSVRAPVADAVAEAVDGWTATSTPDDQGRTVLEWTGGVLPSDQPGAFPIEFVAPDTVGELLTFPAVQRCENGDELPWISGDPTDEFPAPRLLILAPGSEPAATIDDVPLDAPGRDQLTAVIDVDNPGSTTVPSTPESTAPASTAPPTTTATSSAPATEAPTSSADETTTEPDVSDTADTTLGLDTNPADGAGDDGSTSAVWIVVGVIVFVAIAAAAILAARRRR